MSTHPRRRSIFASHLVNTTPAGEQPRSSTTSGRRSSTATSHQEP